MRNAAILLLLISFVPACLSVPDQGEAAADEAVPDVPASADTKAAPVVPLPPVKAYRPPPPKMIPDTGDTIVGNRAPSMKLSQLGGGSMSIEELRGKPILVSFWASWCGPCRAEMPELDKLYKEYASRGLVVLGVNIDREEAAARKFLAGNEVSFPILMDPDSALMGQYEVASMPTNFLIDKRGVVVRKKVGFKPEYIDELKQIIDGM